MKYAVTSIASAFLAFLLLLLLYGVISIRREERIKFGSDNNRLLELRIRYEIKICQFCFVILLCNHVCNLLVVSLYSHHNFITIIYRGHANFTETVPMALILLFFVEQLLPQIYVLISAVILFVGRLLHAYAFSYLHEGKIRFCLWSLIILPR